MRNSPFCSSLMSLIFLTLTTCTSVQEVSSPIPIAVETYFHDALFASEQEPELITAEAFLDLPEQYRRQLDRTVLPLETEHERYVALRRWMFRTFTNFDFDITETYSVSNLNNQRKINCLSFSVMYVAAARYVQVPASFQLVNAPPYWDVENDSWVNNQHIDVTGEIHLESSDIANPTSRNGSNITTLVWNSNGFSSTFYEPQSATEYRYVIDINPAIVSVPLRKRVIDETQVRSLYYSNKSIEALLDGDLGLAYAYTREALRTDSNSAIAWNNLGVIYARVNALELAREAYTVATLMDEETYSAKSNLARTARRLGDVELADQLDEVVRAFRDANPYYHQSLAEIDLRSGAFTQAITHLEDAVARKHNEQIFYHELAIAHQHLGNDTAVIDNLAKARRYARGQEKARYSGKLKAFQELLESQQAASQPARLR